MTDRVFPSAKPPANGSAAGNGGPAAFPATKAQLYNASRPAYRPQPPPRRSKRSICCQCCLWTTILILFILLLAGIAGTVFYVLYRPHRPTFTVSDLHLTKFNLTEKALASNFNFTLTARNRNSKITFFYDAIAVKIFSGDVPLGDGSFPAFDLGKKNTTTMKTVVSSSTDPFPDGTDLSKLRSSLKSKSSIPLRIRLDTKVKVKLGKLKTKKVAVRVTCDGIKVTPPAGNSTATATTSKVKCKADLRVKILKWTV